MDVEIGSKRDNQYRGDYEQENPLLKRSRSDESMIRLLLHRYDCGLVIGPNGENLGWLRSEFNVNIHIPSMHTGDCVLTLSGSLQNCVEVVKHVLRYSTTAPHPVGQQGTVLEFNVLIEAALIGYILGKSGSKIREIREVSNTKIKVYQDCLPDSNERVVAVGCNDPMDGAKALMCMFNAIPTGRERAPAVYYNPAGKQDYNPAGKQPNNVPSTNDNTNTYEYSYKGYNFASTTNVFEAPPPPPPPQQTNYEANNLQPSGYESSQYATNNSQPSGYESSQYANINSQPGGYECSQYAPNIIGPANNITANNNGSSQSNPFNYNTANSSQNVSCGEAPELNFLEATTEARITVSNDICGAIIGRGGSNIQMIRNTSGARITFSEEESVRAITVTGTQQQVQCAEKLLTQSCLNARRK